MATGDQADFVARLLAGMPAGWFPDTAPVLNAVLQGFGAVWAEEYSLIEYVELQSRIATATDVNLDLVAQDYFGTTLYRNAGESDTQFRLRIQRNLLRPRGTRTAMIAALLNLTGAYPWIFEPTDPEDTGGYGSVGMTAGTGLAYNTAGGYGSLDLPFQCFVQAVRPAGQGGIAGVGGYYLGSGWAGGGYGVGALEYATLGMQAIEVTDADIYAEIARTMPCAAIAWTAIVPNLAAPLGQFVLNVNTI